jgi:ribosomal protein S18 acetylase RimI-like enzyme
MSIEYYPMTVRHYVEAYELWKTTYGVGLSSADEPEAIKRYLARNPGLSFVAHEGSKLVGTILGGHDGRRGFIHHLAVHGSHRRLGIGRQLVFLCIKGLKAEGIEKCHLFVYQSNLEAVAFWQEIGFIMRTELAMMSQMTASVTD